MFALKRALSSDSSIRPNTVMHEHLGGIVPLRRLHEMGKDRGIRGVGSPDEFTKALHLTVEGGHTLDSYTLAHTQAEAIQSGPEHARLALSVGVRELIHQHGALRENATGERTVLVPFNRFEIRFDPFKRTGVFPTKDGVGGLYDVDRIVQDVCAAARALEIDYQEKIEVRIVIIFSRDIPGNVHQIQAQKIERWRRDYVQIVGVDLAGPESKQPFSDRSALELFADSYNLAAGDKQLGRTAHIGETRAVGIEEFLATAKALRPTRIAHPLAAFRAYWENNDRRGIDYLVENQIVAEFCPWSNLVSHAVKDEGDIKQLFQTCDHFNIPYALATDNPALHRRNFAADANWLLEAFLMTPDQLNSALTVNNSCRFERKF